MPEEKEKKRPYSFKFHKSFKDDLDMAAEVEGISTTALIERECGRYLRALKKAINELDRKKNIERNINK